MPYHSWYVHKWILNKINILNVKYFLVSLLTLLFFGLMGKVNGPPLLSKAIIGFTLGPTTFLIMVNFATSTVQRMSFFLWNCQVGIVTYKV